MQRFFFSLLFIFVLGTPVLRAQQAPIGVSIDDVRVAQGEQICLPVHLFNFRNMLSMQYTIQFDPEALHFVGVIDQQLPYLNTSNFGLHNAAKGEITVVWIDNALQGVTRPEGDPAFTLCFRVKAAAGTTSEINFTGSPTAFEAVNLQEKVVPINTKKGKVTVQ